MPMLKLTGRPLIVAINLVAGLAIFFFGYDQGMMSGVNTSPDYVERMKIGHSIYEGPSEGFVAVITDPTKQGGIVSIYYFGTLIGALWAGAVGDRIGRIKTMFIGGLWILLGASLQTSAQNTAWMCCARVINGIGTGYLNVIVPVWSAEVASHTTRGAVIAFEFTLNILGVVIAYWLEFGLSFVGDGRTQIRWRLPIAFQILPMLFFMVVIWIMPESPRWLAKVGRTDEALTILGNLRANGNKSDPVVESEFGDILEVVQLEKENAGRSSYWSMFWGLGWGDLHVARRIQLSVWLQIVQEWVGIAAVTVYAPTMFAQAGYSSRKSEWLSGVNTITYCLSTLVAILTIDRFGRRWGLWVGAVVQGIAMFLAGAFSRLTIEHPEMKAQFGAAGAFFIFLYTFTFGATWLTIPWVYPTETFPLEVRAKGMAWGVFGWSIGNGWLTLLNPVMFSRIAENTLHVFGAVNFLSIPMVWAFYPETANRTLEEVDLLFASESPFAWENERCFRELKESGMRLSHHAGVSGGDVIEKGEEKNEV
ncbi:general substrate transporter [Fomitiporia mediterranea MF3/22]|uniref:general substrate transporter n=1 Tax=Fomitiporia mediterranea (strain MF3/22) TaxID=694068 RepID=UPI0004409467|nr:general substrate transporter [Fomitiporia mediterranea MF3/22]EJD04843.1 general substrate transporter [Fomitiporia mediterranea MF3/22]